ncbi:hypothetical protein B0H14DRAFT_3500912 [Mycena olivaceomarginata]|nr:hypothetical protein B0H14DRAFT_3500912 [Mycena olivaceomarginata]
MEQDCSNRWSWAQLGPEFISQPGYRDLVQMFGIVDVVISELLKSTKLTAFYFEAHNIIHAIATSEDPTDAGGCSDFGVMIVGEFIQQAVPLFFADVAHGVQWGVGLALDFSSRF